MVGPAPLDRRVVQGLFATGDGWWCRFALQLWLWLRLRPYRLTDVIGTALSRKFEALVRR